MMPPFRKRYMTLIELIVAMAIFTVIMIILATMLHSSFMISRKRKQQADVLHKQQILWSVLSQDFKNIIVNNTPAEEIYFNMNMKVTDTGDKTALHCFNHPQLTTFITNSGIGVEGSHTSPLTEVFYYLKDDSTLMRCMTTSDDGSQYDFQPNGNDCRSWAGSYVTTRHDTVAENVAEFVVSASWENGSTESSEDAELIGDTGTLPLLFTVSVKIADESDSEKKDNGKAALRHVVKRIFMDRGN